MGRVSTFVLAAQPAAKIRLASVAVAVVTVLYFGNPAIALLVGCGLTLAWGEKAVAVPSSVGKYLLQGAIVLLGLGLSVNTLWELSNNFVGLVSGFVLVTLGVGLLLGRLLGSPKDGSTLIASGTAICGGTAIATLSGVIKASPSQTGVCLAVVFLLNAVALFSFPFIGEMLDLTQRQFGIWAALAIHDTSSVVATAAIYGDEAAEVATTLKLVRTLWLIPVVFVVASLQRSQSARLRVPGFILVFVAAAALGSLVALPDLLLVTAKSLSKAMLVMALFLVGTEISRQTLLDLRGKAALQAVLLWMLVAPAVLGLSLWLG